MLILVSPTKTQKENPSGQCADSLFPTIKTSILTKLQQFSQQEIKNKMKVSDKIAEHVYNNYQNFNETTPALLSYQGSSFKNMNIDQWSKRDFQEANERLYILSALYGLSRCHSAVGQYRLDFLMKVDLDLYRIWKDPITNYLNELKQPILNLASSEYSAMIDIKKLTVPMITIDFKEQIGDNYKTKSTYAKIARGKMVSILIQKQIRSFDEIKKICFDQYEFNSDLSDETTFVFSRKESL